MYKVIIYHITNPYSKSSEILTNFMLNNPSLVELNNI